MILIVVDVDQVAIAIAILLFTVFVYIIDFCIWERIEIRKRNTKQNRQNCLAEDINNATNRRSPFARIFSKAF